MSKVRIGIMESLGKNVFNLLIWEVDNAHLTVEGEGDAAKVVVPEVGKAPEHGTIIERIDGVRGELNAKTRFDKFIEKHNANEVSEVADIMPAADKPAADKKAADKPTLTKEQTERLRHLKSLKRHQLIVEARIVGVKPSPEWPDQQLIDAIMIADAKAVKPDATPAADKPTGATKSANQRLADLGYDEAQIKRMRADVVKTILEQELKADGVSILKDGKMHIVRPPAKSTKAVEAKPADAKGKPAAQVKPQPDGGKAVVKMAEAPKDAEPADVGLSPIDADIIRAARGDQLRALCEERGIKTNEPAKGSDGVVARKSMLLQADLMEWLENHPNAAPEADEGADQSEGQPADGDASVAESDAEMVAQIADVLKGNEGQVRAWFGARKGKFTVAVLQQFKEVETDTRKPPRAGVINLLDGLLAKASKPAKAPKPPVKPRTIHGDTPVKTGYKVSVTNPEWPHNVIEKNEDGGAKSATRWYKLGTTYNEDDATAVAERWAKQGYLAIITDFKQRDLEATNALWMTFSPPIVSAAQLPDGSPDLWVGEHLTAHLRAIGLTLEEYRAKTGYTGPIMVNRALAGLEAAHSKGRNQTLVVRTGQIIVEVKGDKEATVYRLDKASVEEVVLTILADDTGIRMGEEVTMTPAEMFERTHVLAAWTSATKARYTAKPADTATPAAE